MHNVTIERRGFLAGTAALAAALAAPAVAQAPCNWRAKPAVAGM